MHLFFSGIGGAGISPLALIAHQAGYQVSGSDEKNSQYFENLKRSGINDIYIGQSKEQIAELHAKNPIDWYIYSSSVESSNPNAPEIVFCRDQTIKMSKRDEFTNLLIKQNNLKLVAIAGTHGKTTTTAMLVWLFKKLDTKVSSLLPAKTSFAAMGEFSKASEYFIYEADEYDRNFLSFEPYLSLITGVSWDHHEIFPTREDYQQAFKEFIDQSDHTLIWQDDQEYLGFSDSKLSVLNPQNEAINKIKLFGQYNRLDAFLAIEAVHRITKEPIDKLIEVINNFPGLQRRMEEIIPNLYSDYAHTPEKIRGAMSVALEMAAEKEKEVVIVYEPLTDRRQHFIKNNYKDCFSGAKIVYWLPSYLAREDPNLPIMSPQELIQSLDDPSIAKVMNRDEELKNIIRNHLDNDDMVICMNGGGGNSLDEWLRENFKK